MHWYMIICVVICTLVLYGTLIGIKTEIISIIIGIQDLKLKLLEIEQRNRHK